MRNDRDSAADSNRHLFPADRGIHCGIRAETESWTPHEVGKVSLCRYHSGHEPVSTDCDGGEIFDRFREMFGEERTELENLCAHAGQALEYAFDFMEGTFGSSQEMVVFITELNSSASAVRFLQENECERYYEYNKNLLFDEKRADILSRLDRLGAFF